MSDADTAAARPGPRRPGPRHTAKQSQGYGFSTLFKDSVIYGSGRALQRLLNMLLLPLYTAFLTPEDYGVLGMVTTFALLVDVVITLGWDVTMARFYFDSDDPDNRRKVITQTFYVDTIYPVVLIGSLIIFMPWISEWIMGAPGYAVYFDLALASLFFVNINDIPMQLFRLDHRPKTFAAWTIARVFVQVPINVVFVAVFHWGVKGVLLGNLIATILLFIGCLRYWVGRLHISWEPKLLRAMTAFAVANFFANLSFYVLNFSDRYLLRRLGGLEDVGLYQVAFQLATPVYFAGYAFRMAWPQWHYSFLKDPPQHKLRVARGYTYFSFMTAVLIVVVATFLPIFIRVFLRNPAFWDVGSVVLVLLAARAFFNSYHLFLVGVNVTKKNRGLPVLVLIAACLSIGLNLVLIPRWGVMGAATTNAISFFALAAAMRSLANHYYPIPHEWGRVARLVAAILLTLGTGWAILQATGYSIDMPFNELVVRQILIVPTLLIFPAVLWATHFFTRQERRTMATTARRLLRRKGSQEVAEAAAAEMVDGLPVAAAAAGTVAADAGGTGAGAGTDDTGGDTVADDLAAGKATEAELAREEDRMERDWETGVPGDGVAP